MTGRLLRNLQLAGLAGKYKQQESERSGPFSCKKIGNRNFWKTCRKRLPYFWRSGDGDGKSTGSWSYILEGKLSFEVTAPAVRYSVQLVWKCLRLIADRCAHRLFIHQRPRRRAGCRHHYVIALVSRPRDSQRSTPCRCFSDSHCARENFNDRLGGTEGIVVIVLMTLDVTVSV